MPGATFTKDKSEIASLKPEQIFDNIYEVIPKDVQKNNPRQLTPYQIVYENWYKTIPYAFRIENPPTENAITFGKKPTVNPSALKSKLQNAQIKAYFFPVNPESINISTPYAVVVTPTLGGVVEEHSGAVFYNITVSGTTGVIPELNFSNGVPRDPQSLLRPVSHEDSWLEGKANQLGFGGGTVAAVSSIVSAITGTSSKMVDGKRNLTSGYTAYHVLYKFIWLYHFSKANGAQHQLKFVNYKDNNQYNVVVQNFNLTRDKSRPHLYQYSITMRGWNLQTVGPRPSFGDPEQRLKDLGLDTGPSVKAAMFRVINQTKSALSTAAGLLNAAAQDLAI